MAQDTSETSPLLRDQSQANTAQLPKDDEITDNRLKVVKEYSQAKIWTIMGAAWVGVFLAGLDTTVVATLISPITSEFNSLGAASWIASGYFITTSAFQPLSGRMSDIFGRRAGLVFANVFFALGTLMCGLAPNVGTLVAGRVIAGIGGGCLNAISTFIGSDLVPLRQRGLLQGGGNIVFGVSSGLGGYFGGAIADSIGWRWAFLIQLPLIFLSCAAIWYLVDIPVKDPDANPLEQIDFVGSFALVAFLVCFLIPLNSGGNTLPWNHPIVISMLVLSAVLFGLFILWEDKYTKHPVIMVRLFLQRTVWSSCLTNWFFVMAIYMYLYYSPIYYILVGNSSSKAGLRLIPYSLGISVGSVTSGFIMRATGSYRLLNPIINAILLFGLIIVCTFSFSTPSWLQYVTGVFIGIGYGGMLTTTLIALISAVDKDLHAVITSASYAFRSTGSTLGVTFAGAVFQNVLRGQLQSRLGGRGDDARNVIRRVEESLGEVARVPVEYRGDVNESYMLALKAVFYFALGMGVLAYVTSLFLKSHVLHNNLERKDGDGVDDGNGAARRVRDEETNHEGEV